MSGGSTGGVRLCVRCGPWSAWSLCALTAMWAAGYSAEEEIQRSRGRWVSQCFRIYIWEGRERSKGTGSRMLNAKVSMFAAMQSQANRDLREQLQHSSGYDYGFRLAETAGCCFQRPAAVLFGSLGLLQF